MKKETVHIVSHSHWDREWYLSLEEHRMRLVELFDNLFELFETDPNFKSFHLDGQTIVLEDYLAIRPHNREKLQHYIDNGKLKIGPFYILQDDFLISSEANVRNHLIGYIDSKKWGKSLHIGYYPDTFGNVGQVPQLLQQAGVDVAFFGRGVKPVGFDNQVLEDEKFNSQFSEMNWVGADGSQVLGILFANWYSNGNEIPVDKENAKQFWDKKLADVRKYASTTHYLLMNGCDHQPVQKNITQALEVARQLYKDIEFVHSDLDTYVQCVKKELPDDLSTVYGELTSQETDGWYTLTNTASSRIYLKQANDRASKLLEQVVEPLAVMSGETYPVDELRYAWKLLLENAPHDSICGCSIDDVHDEMETRFNKVKQVGHFLKERSLDTLEKKLDTKHLSSTAFMVVNTSACLTTELVTTEIVIDKEDFRDGKLTEHYEAMANIPLTSLGIFLNGEQIEADIEDLGVQFHYDLPKDAFRSANFARKIRVCFVAKDMPPFSWRTYEIKPSADLASQLENACSNKHYVASQPEANGLIKENVTSQPENDCLDKNYTTSQSMGDCLENDYIAIQLDEDGVLTLTNKQTGEMQRDFLQFEDTGDIGNEYIYMAPKGEKPIIAEAKSLRIVYQKKEVTLAKLVHELVIPMRADEALIEEQKKIIEFKDRQAKRSNQFTTLMLTTWITVYKNSPQIQFKTEFMNTCCDHRLRVLLKTPILSNVNVSDSIYETVERSNEPTSKAWQNPTNPQRHRSFVSLRNESKGITVGSYGLHEYEVLNNQTIALTLLRSVGELGDWGYFPTPKAQCLRQCQADYTLEWHTATHNFSAIQRVQANQVHLLTKQVYQHDGHVLPTASFLHHPSLDRQELCVTSLKRAEESDKLLLRYYNLSNTIVELPTPSFCCVDLLEREIGTLDKEVAPQEIRTEVIGGEVYENSMF